MVVNKAFVVIIDLEAYTENLMMMLRDTLTTHLAEDELAELVMEIKVAIAAATMAFLSVKLYAAYQESIHQSIDRISFYGVPMEVAAQVTSIAETDLFRMITNYFPDIDQKKYQVIEHKFLNDGSLSFLVEIVNDH